MNMIDFFDAGVSNHPDAACFEDWSGGLPPLSYAEAGARTCQIARALQSLGLSAGFHGAVLSGNTVSAFLALLGVIRAQGVWLPVNARNSLDSNIDFLADMDCDVLFYQASYSDQIALIRNKVAGIRHFICLDSLDCGADLSLDDFIKGHSGEMFSPSFDPEALAVIMGTGGTTGRSKGVSLSHRNVTMTFANQMSAMHVTEGMTMLAAAPITHSAGSLCLPFMSRGGRIILMDGIDPQTLLQSLEQERVNAIFLPPTVIYALLAQPNVRDFDYSALRYLIYGAAPMSPDKLAEALDIFGPVMLQVYGQSEVPGAITVLRPEEHFIDGKVAPRQRLLSAGRPFPFTRVAVMNEEGNLLPEPGMVGEVVAQGDIVMKGYYKNAEATSEARCNGWHCTGDVGYFDDQGYLFIVDRKKDMIVTGGFNVFSSEVEAAVMAHPAVKDCAVIGIPHEKWGEAVQAVVELRPGQSLIPEQLIKFVKDQLGSVKAPKDVEIVAQLPRSSVGKVLKKVIREKYWKDQERMV
ncbi:Long-chain-fatty-acid--CoA ligase [Alloalcanivorax xenomutans]|uniref:AMP-binding protein n=1 Tax=Alloalcanivorax xenomutans TaxID=1094342 RepID=UPI0006D5CA6E|nr:AMP-binding protein [Alloalcanivorax xenomutans]CUR46478.1 Long-chain-fatty-acid--CoA ligase [Alloalcanivorax xenomutans]